MDSISNSDSEPATAVRYALELAGYARAHLSVRLGVQPLIVPTPGYAVHYGAEQMLVMLEQEDLDQRKRAEQSAAMIQMEAEKRGATATVEVLSAANDPFTPHLVQMARVSDICIMMAPSPEEPQQRDIVLDMLLGSGVPLLLVPTLWKKQAPPRRAVVAWDGSASAARTVRDALPLLARTDPVEVLSVLGEKEVGREAGSHIAGYLARHCREVVVKVLSVGQSGVAATLQERAMLTEADMTVMGGYGHSRLREFVLGGAMRARSGRGAPGLVWDD